jgi:serum/glucocorticoid-regulated kinase 2
VAKNIPVDYYLTIKKSTLSVFVGMHLQLQPFYATPPNNRARVGLREFTLLKCIGVGGFSRVYLVRKKDNG